MYHPCHQLSQMHIMNYMPIIREYAKKIMQKYEANKGTAPTAPPLESATSFTAQADRGFPDVAGERGSKNF